MDNCEPRVRRRGYFLSESNLENDELTDSDAAEGFTIRVRIIRPRLRRSIAAAGSAARGPARHQRSAPLPATRIIVSAQPRRVAAHDKVRSATATDSRPPGSTRR
jgi:hypothetical protein